MDREILLFIQEHIRNPVLSFTLVPLTILGNSGVLLILTGIILSSIKRTRRFGFVFLTALLINFIINDVTIKNMVRRVRPFKSIPELKILVNAPITYSFPSGHTSSVFAVATALLYCSKKYVPYALAVAFLMGFSRVYVGVHYPSDVLVGAVIGVLSGIISIYIYKRLDKRKESKG